MATMTVEEAFDIQAELSELELPYCFNTAPLFGFFKVCLFDHQPRPQSLGTNLSFRRPTAFQPSRSSSSKTGQLSKPENASKRSADTGTIMSETTTRPNSERRVQALARMNYMHGLDRKAGRIKNDDMLYTLGLLVTEPIKWLERFDWRTLIDAEVCALGVYWRDVGEDMDIAFDALRPYLKDKPDDRLSWPQAIMQWSEDYERETMVPAQSNKELGKHTLDILLFGTPLLILGVFE